MDRGTRAGGDRAVIRPARASDIDLLPGIETAAAALFAGTHMAFAVGHPPTPREDFLAGLAAGTLWVSADIAGCPVGFLLAASEADWLHILELAVDPAHGRQGRGRALLQAARVAAHAGGAVCVALTTDRTLPWNAPFYARAGFTELARPEMPGWLSASLDRQAAKGLRPEWRCAMVAPPLEDAP